MDIVKLNELWLERRSREERKLLCGELNRLMAQLTERARVIDESYLQRVCTHSSVFVAEKLTADVRSIHGAAVLVPLYALDHCSGSVQSVVVDVACRGQGIARKLMEEIRVSAKVMGMRCLELSSHPSREAANRLYQSLGYELRETNVYRLKL